MKDELDTAIETAADHALDAQERFVETPTDAPERAVEAYRVERRSEDLQELTADAAKEAANSEGG